MCREELNRPTDYAARNERKMGGERPRLLEDMN
jgi:hypothetical protein